MAVTFKLHFHKCHYSVCQYCINFASFLIEEPKFYNRIWTLGPLSMGIPTHPGPFSMPYSKLFVKVVKILKYGSLVHFLYFMLLNRGSKLYNRIWIPRFIFYGHPYFMLINRGSKSIIEYGLQLQGSLSMGVHRAWHQPYCEIASSVVLFCFVYLLCGWGLECWFVPVPL